MRARFRSTRSRRAAAALSLLLTILPAWLLADVALSQRSSDALQRKILGIQQYAGTTLAGSRLTPVTEAELNSYIRFSLAPQIPTGVVEPYVAIVGGGQVRGRAVVDLDLVRKAKTRGWLDPLAYLSGRVPVTAAGSLTAADGKARLELSETTISGVAVPLAVLQELVGFYSRSPNYPNGVDLDEPFDLPARIKEIHVEAGQAIVVQR
jgi:hypothetical protein